jgi:hypothetical protein
MMGLVKNGADVAFEDAMGRAKEVGVPEAKYAFARVASFLFQGDTAGAAAVLPRWEAAAGGDAWYQMMAGATLERAGDARARDRYATASKLDPELVAAKTALGRTSAIDGDAQEAMRLAKAMRTGMPDRAEPVALVALAWGRDPRREDVPAPPEADEVAKREAELPSGLKFVPHAIAALRALDRRVAGDTRAEVQSGLSLAESPGVAVWLGTIAITVGDETLAKRPCWPSSSPRLTNLRARWPHAWRCSEAGSTKHSRRPKTSTRPRPMSSWCAPPRPTSASMPTPSYARSRRSRPTRASYRCSLRWTWRMARCRANCVWTEPSSC